MYTVEKSKNQRWTYYVRWNGGKPIARCETEVEANRVANALNKDFALPDGWSEATTGGMATNSDPINGGIVDRTIVGGQWFAIANRPGVGPLEGFRDRAAAFDALANALSCTKL